LPEVLAGRHSGNPVPASLQLAIRKGLRRRSGLLVRIGVEPDRPLSGFDPGLDRPGLIADGAQGLIARGTGPSRPDQE
jgi:hypothetical protein